MTGIDKLTNPVWYPFNLLLFPPLHLSEIVILLTALDVNYQSPSTRK